MCIIKIHFITFVNISNQAILLYIQKHDIYKC